MPRFCVNKNAQSTPTREHEVHNLDAGCTHLPLPQNRQALGSFATCRSAVTEANRYFNSVDGCRYCCPTCHTK